jgi:class 3 adenylate cyclase
MLNALLTSYMADPSCQQKAEDMLWAKYGRTGVVLVLDMSRFSLSVRSSGIVHLLSKILRMNTIVRRCIEDSGVGHIVKFESDNAYCHFDDCVSAIACAISIGKAVTDENQGYLEQESIAVSIGIAAGKFLLIPGHGGRSTDFYGDAVNMACSLGVGIADSNQILIESSDDAYSALSDLKCTFNAKTHSISGLLLDTIAIKI